MTPPTLSVSAVQVLALAGVGLWLGRRVLVAVPAIDRLNVPASIVGGLVLAVVQLALRDRVVDFEHDTALRDVAMLIFFTTVGFGARVGLLRAGGRDVVWFLGLATFGAVAQNALGVALTRGLGLHPLLGVATGSMALTGSPATALAFGAEFEKAGVAGAGAVGLAAAVFGISIGGLLGGAIGARLLRAAGGPASAAAAEAQPEASPALDAAQVTPAVLALTVAMGLGTLVSKGIATVGVVLPGYVGAMLVAGALRAVDDARAEQRLASPVLATIGDVALELFIVMALLTLPLWKLAALAVPLLLVLAAQVALVIALCVLVFRVMGRDREAAVMAAGYCGFMLGTTANAMACVRELTARYGPSPRAWLVVPVVGAFLIDFVNSVVVTGLLNWLR